MINLFDFCFGRVMFTCYTAKSPPHPQTDLIFFLIRCKKEGFASLFLMDTKPLREYRAGSSPVQMR
jgi:hypothetical protein